MGQGKKGGEDLKPILPQHRISQNYRGVVLEENNREGVVSIWQLGEGGRKLIAEFGKLNGTFEDRIIAWDTAKEYADGIKRDISVARPPLRAIDEHRDYLD